MFTVSGLNSYFEANDSIVEFFSAGDLDLCAFEDKYLFKRCLKIIDRVNTFKIIYLQEFTDLLKKVFYEGYFDSSVPFPTFDEERDAFCFFKNYPSVFDSNSIFFLVTGKNNSYFSNYPAAKYHPMDAALFWYRGRTFNNYLEVDNALVLPYGTNIKLSITGDDVIHSWAVPSFGVKVDAIPGRINQVVININHPGTFVGQCSELCGALHAFMPINVEAIHPHIFFEQYNFVIREDEELSYYTRL